jgi:hypothetical protein
MATDEMGIDERYQYLKRMQLRYAQADRETKQQLLDEMEAHTGLHRKSLIRRLKSPIKRRVRRRERAKTYGPEVDAALLVIWETLDYICPLRLHSSLVSMGESLGEHHELEWSPHLARQMAEISVSTVGRHLPANPEVHRRRKPAAPQNRHQQEIPAYRIPRDIAEPGHFEVDLVHHCGAVTEGEYVYTLQMIDVATGWGGRRAILGRSFVVMADALAHLFAQLPFPVLELHPDNGGEFLNQHLLTFLERAYPATDRSRSRPGCPNDNRLVEEKNSSRVRQYLGDRRFDTVMQTRFLNRVYAQMDVYHNYIVPVLKQIDKHWVPATATHSGYLRRTHDVASPPLDRLCALWEAERPAQCAALRQARALINPRQLRRTIHADLDHLFGYPNATPGQVENVYETLSDPDRFPETAAAQRAVDTVDKPNSGLPTVPTAPTTTTEGDSSRKEQA